MLTNLILLAAILMTSIGLNSNRVLVLKSVFPQITMPLVFFWGQSRLYQNTKIGFFLEDYKQKKKEEEKR